MEVTLLGIGNSVTSIGGFVFYGCDSLKDIHCGWIAPVYFNPNIYSSATLFVPRGTKEAYQADEDWGMFENIVEE